MQIDTCMLKSEEQVILRLRDIYRKHGYTCFKMSKFEEYDLYGRNKDFLVSDSVITFNDTNGKLMALKPDVTLSIAKNYRDGQSTVQRVYYNENVYRVSDKTHSYKEIMQTGLECMGKLSEYNLVEVISLAAQSLASISDDSVLSISHLEIISSSLKDVENDEAKSRLIKCLSEKNSHGIKALCSEYGINSDTMNLLEFISGAYGEPEAVKAALAKKTDSADILSAMNLLCNAAEQAEQLSGITVRVDLSQINEMKYYNGIVFQGFVKGIPSAVLSGGQYDKLMHKMGKNAGAIGFAVYLDLIERMKNADAYDVDVLLIYKPSDDIRKLSLTVAEIINGGKSVSVNTAVPEKLIYREIRYFDQSEVDK